MKNTTRIVAAVVDTKQLTMYKADGEIIVVLQGDPRLRRIIESAVPQLESNRDAKGHTWADVEIEVTPENSYANFEKESSGIVKFFRVAKAALKNLLTPVVEPVPEMAVGQLPSTDPKERLVDIIATDRATLIEPTLEDARQDLVNVVAAVAEAKKEDAPVITVIVPTPAVQAVAAQLEADAVEVAAPATPKMEQTMSAVNEIIAHAIPVTADDFHERGVAQQGRIREEGGETIKSHGNDDETEHTIIAVVDNKIIPGMEKIKSQFGRAAKMGSTTGVENFLRRISAVIENRGHSVEDLLKFMERADLPIADDGTIIIYKMLNRKAKDAKGSGINNYYVDCHSGNVTQFVGAYVCMAPEMVDPNRSQDCSNGLHVARRGYLRSFSGNVCVLAKLAPEDVIAVPQYDANKMRVCGYHIIAELNQAMFQSVKQNSPITTSEEGRVLLAKAIAGDHIRKTHEVRITGSMGAGVKITELKKPVEPEAAFGAVLAELKQPATMADVPAKLISDAADATEQFGDDELERFRDEQIAKGDVSHGLPPGTYTANIESVSPEGDIKIDTASVKPVKEVEALADPEAEMMDQPTDPRDVVKTVEKAVEAVKLTRAQEARALYDAWFTAPDVDKGDRFAALMKFKKAAKKGWDVLGIPDPTKPAPSVFDKTVKAAPVVFEKTMERSGTVIKKTRAPNSSKGTKVPAEGKRVVNGVELGLGGPKERIAKLLAIGLTSVGTAGAILAIKKSAKKSWDVLGVTPEQVEQILKLSK